MPKRDVGREAHEKVSAAVADAMSKAEAEAKAAAKPFVHSGKMPEKDERAIHNQAEGGRVRAAREDAANRAKIEAYRSLDPDEKASLGDAIRQFHKNLYRQHGNKYGTAGDLHPDDAKLFGVKR